MRDIDQTSFKAEVKLAGESLSPARAGLLFAREIAFPRLRPSDYVIQLEDLAAAAQAALAAHTTPETRGLALAEFLFHTVGFRGNGEDYGDPRNAYLNEVIERRLGLPISLAVIYLDVAQRLQLPVAGIGMPGHFVVSVIGPSGPIYLDPFHGGLTLTAADCSRLVTKSTGYGGAFEARWLEPTPPREIVARMLNNLRNHYLQAGDWPLAIAVIDHLRDLQPGVASHLRDLGLLHYRNGAYRKASQLLDQYLVRAPDATDSDSVRQSRDMLLDQLARLN